MRIFYLFFGSFFLITPAFAQGAYVPPRNAPNIGPTPSTPQGELDELLDGKKVIRQPETIADYTYLHYKQCLATEHPILAGKDLQRMCSCTAANFSKTMSVADIREIEAGSAEGVFQRNRLLYFVYAPCVPPIIAKMVTSQCMSNKKNAYMMKNQGGMCACLGDRMETKFEEIVPAYIQDSMLFPSSPPNPLDLLVHERTFETQLRHFTNTCLFKYERRVR